MYNSSKGDTARRRKLLLGEGGCGRVGGGGVAHLSVSPPINLMGYGGNSPPPLSEHTSSIPSSLVFFPQGREVFLCLPLDITICPMTFSFLQHCLHACLNICLYYYYRAFLSSSIDIKVIAFPDESVRDGTHTLKGH